MTNEREEEQRGEAADNEYERRKDNECDAEREREGKAMKLNIEELKQKALAVASKNWIEGNSYCEISDDSEKFVAQAYGDSRADAIANAAFIAAASPVPAPAVTEYMVPFTDNDLAEIHQLAYEIGGTDSGEYILDGEQLDQVIVKAASLFYKPAVAVPAVLEEWRAGLSQLLDTFERCEAGFPPHVELRFAVRDKARALLQSAPQSSTSGGKLSEQLGNSEQLPNIWCWCRQCRPDVVTMILCPTCGNKRCPHANDHRNACTGSNEPGQPGSAYPQPEKFRTSAKDSGV